MACSDSKSSNPAHTTTVDPSAVILTEVSPANTGFKDQFGQDPGWVELFNPTDTAVPLEGYGLSTDSSQLRAWTFGPITLASQERLVVFLSGRDISVAKPPSDSISLIGHSAWGWADNQNKPAGHSRVAPYEFSDYLGEVDGQAAISGSITLADNSDTQLPWSSASVFLGLGNATPFDTSNISATTHLVFEGYIDAGKTLEIRLAQPDLDDYKGWASTVIGTGLKNDRYTIQLPMESTFPDLKNIYGLRFASPANQYSTVNFTFTSIYAFKQEQKAHASIKLSKSGGQLFLSAPQGSLADSVSYHAVRAGLSYARDSLQDPWTWSTPPTPGAPNAPLRYTGLSQAPAGFPVSGHYSAPFTLTLPTPPQGVHLRCDTTGAEPTLSSPIQGGALPLTHTTVLRCAQFQDQHAPSEITLRTYLINERLPDLPVFSITTDPGSLFDPDTGLYQMGPHASLVSPYFGANFWSEKELPVQIDFFEPQAKHAWTATAGFKIFGNYSRGHAKKSVSLTFKEKYGQNRLEYPLFPEFPQVQRFKSIVLRNNGNNATNDYIRDALMSSLTEGLGIDYQKNRSVIVYYNGEYFGIHQLRERATEYYFESNYGFDPAHIDLVKAFGEATSGSDIHYQETMKWIESNPLDKESNYQWVQTRLDIDNFMNYLQTEIFIVNKDWPSNNLKRWRENSKPTRWKWFLYDTDFGFGNYNPDPEVNMLEFATATDGPDWPNPPYSTFLFRALLENTSFRHAFINRFQVLLQTHFSPKIIANRITQMMDPLQNEIPLDQKRWSISSVHMDKQLAVIQDFGKNRAPQLKKELESFFELEASNNLDISIEGSGSVLVHGLPVKQSPIAFTLYKGVPVVLEAQPLQGATFAGWSDGIKTAQRTITPDKDWDLKALFR